MQHFKDIVNHRRAVREYDANQSLDPKLVKECLELSQLAPSSSNMQLYEFYHITDAALLDQLAKACLSQQAATSAQQMVVFVTRQDHYAKRAKAALAFERGNIKRYSPESRQAARIKRIAPTLAWPMHANWCSQPSKNSNPSMIASLPLMCASWYTKAARWRHRPSCWR